MTVDSVLHENQSEKLPDITRKSTLWRPFSPSPSPQTCKTVKSNSQKKNTYANCKNTFLGIKPSNVKIGTSKASVFKAVKRNSYSCTKCFSHNLNNRQLNSHMRAHFGKYV